MHISLVSPFSCVSCITRKPLVVQDIILLRPSKTMVYSIRLYNVSSWQVGKTILLKHIITITTIPRENQINMPNNKIIKFSEVDLESSAQASLPYTSSPIPSRELIGKNMINTLLKRIISFEDVDHSSEQTDIELSFEDIFINESPVKNKNKKKFKNKKGKKNFELPICDEEIVPQWSFRVDPNPLNQLDQDPSLNDILTREPEPVPYMSVPILMGDASFPRHQFRRICLELLIYHYHTFKLWTLYSLKLWIRTEFPLEYHAIITEYNETNASTFVPTQGIQFNCPSWRGCDHGIQPQSGDCRKMISHAKMIQRLSDHDLGGGLGKKKRLNRLIAQGEQHRFKWKKKKCPVSIKDKNDQKSSITARSQSISNARDDKNSQIVPQAFGLSVPIVVDNETLELMESLVGIIKNKKIDMSDDVKIALEKLTEAIGNSQNIHMKHSIDLSQFMPSYGKYDYFNLCFILVMVYLYYTDKVLLRKAISLSVLVTSFNPNTNPVCAYYKVIIMDWLQNGVKRYQPRPLFKVDEEELDTGEPPRTVFETVEDDEDEEIVIQGLSTTVIDAIIAFMYYGHAASSKWDKNPLTSLSSFFSKTRDMRKIKDGMEFTFSSLLSYIQVFVDWMAKTFGFERYDITMDGRPEIVVYSEKVTSLLKQFTEGKILNSESAKDVIALYAEGNKIAKALPNSPEYVDARKLIQATIVELSPLMLKIRRSNLNNSGPRIQPVSIFLTGPPGVGKTLAMTPMMLAVTARTIPKEMVPAFTVNHNDFIYNRQTENVFWDSYNGQYNVIMDDFGQVVDVAGVSQNECMEFIRMVNSNSMDLHMAHLEDKGVTGFRAKFVWATSNVNKFNLKSIHSAAALTRRFMVSYMVVPAPGYREDESETNWWKMRLKAGTPYLEGSPHLDYYKYDVLNGEVLSSTPVKIGDVTEEIMRVHWETQRFGKLILETNEKAKIEALKMRALEIDLYSDTAETINPQFHEETGEVPTIESDDPCIFDKIYNNLLATLNRYKDNVYHLYAHSNVIASVFPWLSTMKTLLVGAAILTAGMGVYKMMTGKDESIEQSSEYLGGKARSRAPKKVNQGNKTFRKSLIKNKPRGKPQLAFDATCDDIMYKIFKKNVYTFHQSTTSEKMGCVTFIGGHDAFMPRHFAEGLLSKVEDGVMDPKSSVVLRCASHPELFYEFSFNLIDFYFDDQWGDEDICFARFPNVIPQAPDIRKYVMEDSDILKKKFSGKLLRVDSKGTLHVPFTEIIPMTDLPYTEYINPHGYCYPIPTKEGDCGSLLFVSNPLTGSHKLIGQHVAGKTAAGIGYASRICSAHIKSYDDFMKGDDIQIDEPQAFDKPFTTDSFGPQSFKTLFKDRKANVPIATSIVPSPLYGTFRKSKFAPAKLRSFKNADGVEVDPWLKARTKYAKSSPYMNQSALDQCAYSYGSKIVEVSANDAPWGKKVFTFEDAVRGVPGVPNCEGVPRGTSSGYPFCLDIPTGHKGKSHFFGKGDDYEFDSPYCSELRHRVSNIISEAAKGNRLEHIYFDFLKDERRPLEKSSSGSSRLVSASPVDLLIATRMYFMDFVRWYMSNRILNGSAVGVNAFSSEWELMRKCLNGNPNVDNLIAGDFAAYDACLTRQIQQRFLDFVNCWYNDGNDLIRSVLFEEVCNSKHIYGDVVYEWPGGNPSGNFLTTILNTFCNNVILRYAGLLCWDEFKYGPGMHIVSTPSQISTLLSKMEVQIYILAYGDDNLISVGESMRPWFGQSSLTRAFAKIGFTYTCEDKDDSVTVDHRSISNVSFLKRCWLYDPVACTYVSPLSLDTVLEMSQWTTKKDKDFNYVKDTIDTTLKELSAHGEIIWKEWSKKIKDASIEHLGYMSPIVDRRHALSLQMSRESIN